VCAFDGSHGGGRRRARGGSARHPRRSSHPARVHVLGTSARSARTRVRFRRAPGPTVVRAPSGAWCEGAGGVGVPVGACAGGE